MYPICHLWIVGSCASDVLIIAYLAWPHSKYSHSLWVDGLGLKSLGTRFSALGEMALGPTHPPVQPV
jgi:hypothetical protein